MVVLAVAATAAALAVAADAPVAAATVVALAAVAATAAALVVAADAPVAAAAVDTAVAVPAAAATKQRLHRMGLVPMQKNQGPSGPFFLPANLARTSPMGAGTLRS